MNLSDLSEAAGVPARTIRFWISEGMAPGPEGTTKGAEYGQGHLDRLLAIKTMQRSGMTNAEIRQRFEEEPTFEPEAITHRIAPGIELRVIGHRLPKTVDAHAIAAKVVEALSLDAPPKKTEKKHANAKA